MGKQSSRKNARSTSSKAYGSKSECPRVNISRAQDASSTAAAEVSDTSDYAYSTASSYAETCSSTTPAAISEDDR